MTLPLVYNAGAPPPSTSGVLGPYPDDRLSIVVDRPDGTQHRWGPDELDAANIPTGLSFGTSMPGGFKQLVCQLLRDIGLPGREGLFDDVRVLGAGQECVWEGRIQQMPVSTADGGRVSPQAVGWSAHLEDDQTAREIYIDRDLASWTSMPPARRKGVIGLPYKPHDGTTGWYDSDPPGPAIDLNIPGYAWSSAYGQPDCEMWYDADGIPLSTVNGRWSWHGGNAPCSPWQSIIGGSADGVNVPSFSTLGGYPGDVWWDAPGPTYDHAVLIWRINLAPSGSPDSTYWARWSDVSVRGRHGVAYHGDLVSGGLLGSDVIGDALSRWAPVLSHSPETITATDLPIRHLTFRDPTTASDIVQSVNAFHVWDWAVWEARTFWFHPRGARGRTWVISTQDGLDLSMEGDTTDLVYNGVVVSYQDYAGRSHTIGPDGADTELHDSRLVSYDDNNPATTHGIRKWGVLELSNPSDPESAAVIGQAWLGAQAEATRKGSATVYGWVRDEHGNMFPVSRVRAGDRLIVSDRPDDPPRRIVETSYQHPTRSNQLTLDSTAATLDAMLERVGVALVGRL